MLPLQGTAGLDCESLLSLFCREACFPVFVPDLPPPKQASAPKSESKLR